MHESPPRINSGFIVLSPMIAFITYKGDVPMSPYIIPSVSNNPPADNLECMF